MNRDEKTVSYWRKFMQKSKQHIRWQTKVWFLISLFLVPVQGQADNSGMAVLGDELSLFQEIPSVFSASKYAQKSTEAPSSVSIITADEIKKAGYRTLADVLASVRGFYVYTDHNYQYLGVRGFARPGDYNSRILLLIDGHRVNDAIYSTASIGTDFYLDLDLVERIEIVRGPSSSLYGSSAFFGVVNVFTKRGRDYKGPEVSVSVGDDDQVGGRLTYGKKFSNGLELLLSGSSSKSDGADWYFEEFDDPYYNNGHAEGIDEAESYTLFLKATVADFTFEAAHNVREDGYPTAAWETEFNNPDANTLDEHSYADLKYEHITESDLEITSRIYYDYYYLEGIYPYDWADYDADPASDPYILNGLDYAHSELWGGEFQAGTTFRDKHRVIVGAEYRDGFTLDQDYYNYRFRTVAPEYDYINSHTLNSDEDAYTWGLYLQDEYRINEKFILNAGLRLDHYSSFGSTSNPRAALIYNPRSKTTLKLLYGSAFRAPTPYELFYHDAGETMLANPDLDPETIDTYEVVWEEMISNRLKAVVNAYYYRIEDLITQDIDADGLLIFQNVEEIESRGIEFELEGTVWDTINTRFSYSYQKTEDAETGSELSNSPRSQGKLNISFPLWKDLVFMNLEEHYLGSKLTVATDQRLDAAWVSNLTLYAQNAVAGLGLSFSVYNLFDEQYQTPGSGEHLQPGLEQDGRKFLLKATYAF